VESERRGEKAARSRGVMAENSPYARILELGEDSMA